MNLAFAARREIRRCRLETQLPPRRARCALHFRGRRRATPRHGHQHAYRAESEDEPDVLELAIVRDHGLSSALSLLAPGPSGQALPNPRPLRPIPIPRHTHAPRPLALGLLAARLQRLR